MLDKVRIALAGALVALVAGWCSDAKADGPTKSASILPDIPGVTTKGSWTGFYVGAHVGYGWNTFNGNMIYTDAKKGDGFDASSKTIDADGMVAGGLLGFNYQTGLLVWGIEVDGSWSNISGNAQHLPYPTGYPKNGSPAWDFNSSVDWLATVRGRLGFTSGNTLIYGTGGIAFAGVETNLDVVGKGYNAWGSKSETLVGWTLGGGFEWALSGNWTMRAEYLYYRFDDAGGILSGQQTTSCKTPCAHTTDGFAGDMDLHTVRLGVSKRF